MEVDQVMMVHLIVFGLVGAIGLTAYWQANVIRVSAIFDPLPTDLPFPEPELWASIKDKNLKLHKILQPLGVGQLPHPEDLAYDHANSTLYASCSDGWIKQVHLPTGSVTNWTKIDGGRPLGLAIGLHGEIIACEPSLGLLNVTKGNVEVLTNNVCGDEFKFVDGVDIGRDDGNIYFTDASTKFGYGESDYDVLEGRPHGRLLMYDPSTNKTIVLARKLYFPNGVALSSDQSFLVFCETAKVRCQRMWLKGECKGEMEVFIDNLPGYPDNIHITKRGTFWISLVSGRSLLMETLLRFPTIKHFYATHRGIQSLNVAPYMAKVIEVNNEGKPIRYLEDPNGASIGFVTSSIEIEDHLYLGGLASTYIGKVKLKI